MTFWDLLSWSFDHLWSYDSDAEMVFLKLWWLYWWMRLYATPPPLFIAQFTQTMLLTLSNCIWSSSFLRLSQISVHVQCTAYSTFKIKINKTQKKEKSKVMTVAKLVTNLCGILKHHLGYNKFLHTQSNKLLAHLCLLRCIYIFNLDHKRGGGGGGGEIPFLIQGFGMMST